jgi:hypothetical protein
LTFYVYVKLDDAGIILGKNIHCFTKKYVFLDFVAGPGMRLKTKMPELLVRAHMFTAGSQIRISNEVIDEIVLDFMIWMVERYKN